MYICNTINPNLFQTKKFIPIRCVSDYCKLSAAELRAFSWVRFREGETCKQIMRIAHVGYGVIKSLAEKGFILKDGERYKLNAEPVGSTGRFWKWYLPSASSPLSAADNTLYCRLLSLSGRHSLTKLARVSKAHVYRTLKKLEEKKLLKVVDRGRIELLYPEVNYWRDEWKIVSQNAKVLKETITVLDETQEESSKRDPHGSERDTGRERDSGKTSKNRPEGFSPFGEAGSPPELTPVKPTGYIPLHKRTPEQIEQEEQQQLLDDTNHCLKRIEFYKKIMPRLGYPSAIAAKYLQELGESLTIHQLYQFLHHGLDPLLKEIEEGKVREAKPIRNGMAYLWAVTKRLPAFQQKEEVTDPATIELEPEPDYTVIVYAPEPDYSGLPDTMQPFASVHFE